MDLKIIKKFILNNLIYMVFLVISLILVEIGSVVLIQQTGSFMNKYITNNLVNTSSIFNDLIFVMILLLGVLISRFIYKALDFYLSNKGMIYLESNVLDHLMHVQLENTLLRNKIELAQQVNNDSVVISDYWLSQFPNLILKICKILIILFIISRKSLFTSILLVVVSAIYLLIFVLSQNKYKELNLDMIQAQQNYFGVLGGELLNVFLVKANSWYDRTINRFEDSGGKFVDKSIKFLNFDYFLSNIIGIFTQSLTIIIPVILLLRGEASLAVFFILITLSQMYLSDLSSTIDLFKSFSRKKVSSSRLDALLSMPVDYNGDVVIQDIEILKTDNLDFSYSGSNRVILNNLNHLYKKNTITSIIGHNGSGKSTLIKILIGLMNPTRGDVKINNISLKDMNMELVRKEKIAFCEQEPYLLPDTILNNLNYGLDEPKGVDYYMNNPLLDFVSKLDDGFDTMISSGSQNLSGGQKQKIALVRTMAKDGTSLLIFDEPTSALDIDSIKIFMEYLQYLKRDKAIIIITHEQSIIDYSDLYYKLN